VEINPKKLMNSQEFISIIREEYRWRTGREEESTNLVIQKPQFKPPKPNLAQCISNNTSNSTQKWCSHCKHKNHNDTDCHFLNDTLPCSFCGLKGHTDKTCRKKRKKEKDEKGKKRKSGDNGGGDAKRQKKDVANVVEEEVISFLVNGEDYNYDTFNVSDSLAMDERISYYDEWVVDTGTTSHITNRRDAFITYQALGDKIVSGV